MDNGEYAPFHDRFSAPALWSQLTPAIPYQRPRQPYPERISYTPSVLRLSGKFPADPVYAPR